MKMDKFTKICLSFCAITIIIGIVLSIIGFSLGAKEIVNIGWNGGKFDVIFDDDATTDSIKSDDATFTGIEKLNIDLKYVELNIKEAEGNEIKVESINVPDDFKCYSDGNELVIESKKEYKHWKKHLTRVNVYIPKGTKFEEVEIEVGACDSTFDTIETEELSLSIGAGALTVDKMTVSKSSDIMVGAGEVIIKDLEAQNANLEVGAGSMSVKGKLSGDTNIDCGMGSVDMHLSNAKREFNYDISGGMGEIVIGESTYSGMGFEDHIDNDVDGTMEIECGMGSVTVEFGDTL